jgi:phage/plasmid primase-like uncharacterized protein
MPGRRNGGRTVSAAEISELRVGSTVTRRDTMTAAIARIFPHATAASVANIETFVSIALFSGVGLLLSLSVLLLDQYIPGEWF